MRYSVNGALLSGSGINVFDKKEFYKKVVLLSRRILFVKRIGLLFFLDKC